MKSRARKPVCGEPLLFSAPPAERMQPASESAPLIGIARMASEAESLRQGHEVEYFTLAARSLLNRCSSSSMPFTWTINPYRGCEFACRYCYARYTHEFLDIHNYFEFEHRIFVKQNVRTLLRRDLRKVRRGEGIAIGSATDPYQPAERRYEATRAILEELAEQRGLDLSMISKSDLILRDLDLLAHIARNNSLWINLTVTTMDAQLARILEPRAPRPDLRLHAVAELNRAGIDCGVICAPVMPGITDQPDALEAIVSATKQAGGQYIFANALHLRRCSAMVFLPFVAREFPHLLAQYRARFSRSAFTSREYRLRLRDLMRHLRAKYKLRYHDHPAPPEFEPILFEPPEMRQSCLFEDAPPRPGRTRPRPDPEKGFC